MGGGVRQESIPTLHPAIILIGKERKVGTILWAPHYIGNRARAFRTGQ